MNPQDEITLTITRWLFPLFSTLMVSMLAFGIKWLRSIAQSIDELRLEMAKRTSAEDRLIEKVSHIETRQERSEQEIQDIKLKCATSVFAHRRSTDPGEGK